MKAIVILSVFLLTPLNAISDCLFLENKTEINELSALRDQANLVLDAEGENCASIKDRDTRSACQCKYRKEPLIEFKKKYDEVLIKNPEYRERLICYSEKTKQGISVNFTAYKNMTNWCV